MSIRQSSWLPAKNRQSKIWAMCQREQNQADTGNDLFQLVTENY